MRIIIFDTFATTASIGKITNSMFKMLKDDGNEVLVLHGYNDGFAEEHICLTNAFERKFHYIFSKITGLDGYYSNNATDKALRIIDSFNPDIVQLYNLHGWYLNINKLLNFLKTKNIPTVYSMLDEFPYLGRCYYSFECSKFSNKCKECSIDKKTDPETWFFRRSEKIYADKLNTYNGFKNLSFVGPKWVLERAKKSPAVRSFPMYEVDEFVDVDNLFYPRKQYKYVKDSIVNEKRKIILTVTVFSNPRKGGQYFLDVAKRFENSNEYLFVYVGMDVENVALPSNCVAFGFVKNQEELAEYYSCADLFICTSCADTMPNSCLESLSCGTPILGFDITGIPYVAERPNGAFVPVGDIDAMESEILKVEKKNENSVSRCRRYAECRYSPQVYFNKMNRIYNVVLDKQ